MGLVITSRVPVLTYHSLDDSGSPVSIAPSLFRRQMEWLRDNGWQTLTVDQFTLGLNRGEWVPRSCLLTFDDGFANFAEHALPVLTACGFTSVVFVVADWVGRTNDWPGQVSWVPRHSLMDWESLRAIVAAGMEIGGHSCSHPHLASLGSLEAEQEVVRGKNVIEDRTGSKVRAFAYPYGEATGALEAVVARHFRVGFGTRLGFMTPPGCAADLPRIDAYYLRRPWLFHAIETPGLGVYLRARQWVRDLKRIGRI